MSRIKLVRFTGPRQYGDHFLANLNEIRKVDDDGSFCSLISALAGTTGIPAEIVSLEVKRSLAFENEVFPDSLRLCLKSLLTIPCFLLNPLRYSRRGRPFAPQKADIIVDAWYKDSKAGFYGEQLLSGLSEKNKCLYADFTAAEYYRFLSAVKILPAYFRAWICGWRIFIAHGLDLQRFIYRFFVNYLTGREFASIGARVVLSGNDNGCPTIKAYAAGAKTFFIQNGLRSYISDTSFRYADNYASIGKGKLQDVFEECGCRLKHIHALGSLRLNNYIRTTKKKPELRYDFLFVETGYITYFFQPDLSPRSMRWFDISFSKEATIKALKLIKDFADENKFRVALQTQYKGELEIIKKLGCYSDKIAYFEKEERSVYETVMESDVVVSTVSTVCQEAMGIGKRACYVNFSGNRNFNRLFSGLDIEYTSESTEDFVSFLQRVKKVPLDDFYAFVRQDPDYVPKLVDLVRKAVQNKPSPRQ